MQRQLCAVVQFYRALAEAIANAMPKSLKPEQSNLVRETLRSLLAEAGGNRSALARRIGISGPSLYEILENSGGVSYLTARAVAKVAGVTTATLLGEPPADVAGATDASHPHLVAAVAMVGTHASAATCERVRHAAAFLPDLSTGTWTALLLEVAASEGASVGAAGHPKKR